MIEFIVLFTVFTIVAVLRWNARNKRARRQRELSRQVYGKSRFDNEETRREFNRINQKAQWMQMVKNTEKKKAA